MKIYLATDHGGFELKNQLKSYLEEKGLDVEDCGNFVYEEGDDYPDWIGKGAEKLSQDPTSFGIFLGKSGAGECIVANKFKNVRAIVGSNRTNVELARKKNNANALCIGGDFISLTLAKEFVDIFLNTQFSNEERHVRRINEIDSIEQK